MKSDAFFLPMPPNFQARDPDFARRFEPRPLQFQLDARCNCTDTLPRALTFDMRGAQKAQPFGHPLDEVVRARRGLQLLASIRDGLGAHRVVLEFVFQVRPIPKNAQRFVTAAALCWIVRFAARLS